MIISEDRQTHLAHIVTDQVWEDDLVDFTDDDLAVRSAKRAVASFVKDEADLDLRARAKVSTLKRNVMENTPEWDVLYRKYYEEERGKRGQK